MAETFIWTAQDELERLLVTQQFTDQNRQRQLARTAILNCLRELPYKHRWAYYIRRYTLRTTASQSGTLTYDHTGGASERLVTLVTATLPTDGTGEYHRIIIDNVAYDIQRVLSASTCQLSPNNNPGEDVAAGTACTVYRAFYPLPVGFRRLNHVWDVEDEHEMPQMTEDDLQHQGMTCYITPDTPWYVGVTSAGELMSAFMLQFSPPPSQSRTYDIMYEASPQPIRTWKYSTGTATSTGNSTITIATGMTSIAMLGAILRMTSSTSVEPTSIVSSAIGGIDNPHTVQRTIIDVPTSSTLAVDAAVTALAAVKYTISDPIDVENGGMLLAFQRQCDAEYSFLLQSKEWKEKRVAADRDLRLAMENDQRLPYSKSALGVLDPIKRASISTDAG